MSIVLLQGGRMFEAKTRLEKKHAPHYLTQRHIECLRAFAEGYTYKETAKTLGVSVQTLKPQIKDLMRRLDVVSQAQAVALALRRGIIE